MDIVALLSTDHRYYLSILLNTVLQAAALCLAELAPELDLIAAVVFESCTVRYGSHQTYVAISIKIN